MLCSSQNNKCSSCAPNLQLFAVQYYFFLPKIGFSEFTNPFSSKKYLNMSKDYHNYDNYIANTTANVKLRDECINEDQPFCECNATSVMTAGTSYARNSYYSREVSDNGELYTVYKTRANAKVGDYKNGGSECNFCEAKALCDGKCNSLGTTARTVLEIKSSSNSCYEQNIISQSCLTWENDGSGGTKLVNCSTLATQLVNENPVCSNANPSCNVTPTNISIDYCPNQGGCAHLPGNIDDYWGQYGCFDMRSYWVGSWNSYASQNLSQEDTCENIIEAGLKLKQKLIDIYSDNKILGDCYPSRCGGAALDDLNIGKDNCWAELNGGFYLYSSSCVNNINANGIKIKIAAPKEEFNKEYKSVSGKVKFYISSEEDIEEGRTPCCNDDFSGTVVKEAGFSISNGSKTFKDNFLAVDVGELHNLEYIIEDTSLIGICISVDSVSFL